jgi:hypothetical protein
MGPCACARPAETSDIEERVSDDENGMSFPKRPVHEATTTEPDDASDVAEMQASVSCSGRLEVEIYSMRSRVRVIKQRGSWKRTDNLCFRIVSPYGKDKQPLIPQYPRIPLDNRTSPGRCAHLQNIEPKFW